MTSTNTLNPRDTGEIELGGETARLSEYAANLPPTRGLRRPDATGEIILPSMPRFLDDAPVQPIFPLERVIDVAADEVPVEHHDLLRRSVPFVFPEGYVYRGRTGKHRLTVWAQLRAFVARWVKR